MTNKPNPSHFKLNKLAPALMLATIAATGTSTAFADDAAEKFRADFLAQNLSWDDVRARAKQEGEVNLYYWGGSDAINVWIDSAVEPALAALGVKLNPVRITATKDAIDLVLVEKNAGKSTGDGSVDVIWLNGENFFTLSQQNALFGAFADKLPNSIKIEWDSADPRALLNLRDFGVETRFQEMPWSGEQYVCAVNRKYVATDDTPHTFAQMKTYLTANPGKFAYVKPPHYIGNTFVQEVIYAHNPDGTGAAPFQNSLEDLGSAELARLITPGLQYLKSIEPLLADYNSGNVRYPEDTATLDGMFLNGEVHFNCKFGLFATATALTTGAYPEQAEEFIFPANNMIKNKNYLAIPVNSPNPASALVMINYMSSVEAQASKLKATGMPVGIDPWKLSSSDAAILEAAAPDHIGVTQADLDDNIAPDTNASLVDVIEAVWLDHIERNDSASIADLVAKTVAAMK